MIHIDRLTILEHMAQTPRRIPLIIPLVNFPFGWRPSLVPWSLSPTWNPSFLCGEILVHPGSRLLVNWPPPPLSLPIPISHPQRFPIPIMCPSTTTSRHRLHIVRYSFIEKIHWKTFKGTIMNYSLNFFFRKPPPASCSPPPHRLFSLAVPLESCIWAWRFYTHSCERITQKPPSST
jgi:hypothetical protein